MGTRCPGLQRQLRSGIGSWRQRRLKLGEGGGLPSRDFSTESELQCGRSVHPVSPEHRRGGLHTHPVLRDRADVPGARVVSLLEGMQGISPHFPPACPEADRKREDSCLQSRRSRRRASFRASSEIPLPVDSGTNT